MLVIYIFVLIQLFKKMVSSRTRNFQQKKLLSQLNEALGSFLIRNGTNVSAMENDILEQQSNCLYNDSERIVGNASQNQVIGNNMDNRIRQAVDNSVMTAKNHIQDPVLLAMHMVAIPWDEMALSLITGSSGHGPNSVVQNPDRRDFSGNTDNTPPMSASRWLDLRSR